MALEVAARTVASMPIANAAATRAMPVSRCSPCRSFAQSRSGASMYSAPAVAIIQVALPATKSSTSADRRLQLPASEKPATHQLATFSAATGVESKAASSAEGTIHTVTTRSASVAPLQPCQSMKARARAAAGVATRSSRYDAQPLAIRQGNSTIMCSSIRLSMA
jgi:hypothetical protein